MSHQTVNQTPESQKISAMTQGGLLQRKCDCGSSAMSNGRCAEGRGNSELLRRQSSLPRSSEGHNGEAPPIVDDVLRSPGQPLEPAIRAFFEPRFGHDFSRVRTHQEGRAADSARAVNALAYTVGQHVVFGAGRYAPGTLAGRKLLAHELAHVVQQRSASYPVGGVGVADSSWEHEADAAAEAIMDGRTAMVARKAVGPQLARQTVHRETQAAPKDAAGRRFDVTRVVTAGKCAEIPKTRTTSDTEITRSHAAIELTYCRGRTQAGARGELDYSDVVRRAVSGVPGLFTGGDPKRALSDLERSFKQAEPRARVRFELQVGPVKAQVTGSGKASIEGGASGEAEATVGGRIGTTGVEGGVSVSGGEGEATRVGVTIKITPGAGPTQTPHCFKCTCTDPKVQFTCVGHEPETPGKSPPKPKETLYVPVFFEYEKTVPRVGRENDYTKALDGVVDRLREGYTIARIEGRTSPEGSLARKRAFEGNIALAQNRATQARNDLNVVLSRAIGKEELKVRDFDQKVIRLLRAAREADYEVKGLAPRGEAASAELFGSTAKGEVSERDMLKHLRQTLKAPENGEPDPLALEHVTGEGLPADVRAEVEAEVEVFRSGKRGGKALKERELLETIYRPLRRALIVLNPPRPSFSFQRPEAELAKVTGKPMDKCQAEHEALFVGKPIPEAWLYEGACRPEGGPGAKVK